MKPAFFLHLHGAGDALHVHNQLLTHENFAGIAGARLKIAPPAF
jgi:hypothetical protein